MNAPAKQELSIFDILSSDKATAEMQRIASGSFDATRFAQISTTTIKAKWNDLKGCSPFSIFLAVLEAAQLDLDTSVAANEFYFIPMKGQCVGMLGYRGMLRLAYRSGAVDKIDARLVFAGDEFHFAETQDGPTWSHVPYWQTGKDKGPIRFAYGFARLINGEIVFKVADQERIKAAYNASKARATWEKHPEAMTTKTAIRELWKWLPRDGIDRKVAFAVDDDAVREGEGPTAGRVHAEWARGEFNLPPENLAELQAAPGLEPDEGEGP